MSIYRSSMAKLIAKGSEKVIKGIFWCGDVTVERMKWGESFLKRKICNVPDYKGSEKVIKGIFCGNHVEFKGVDSSLFYDDGKLYNVPDSRQAIFKDKSLSLAEKREMMKFLKVVQGHFGDGVNKVEEEDLGLPFLEFLKKQGLPSRITSIILYAIVMADWDQESKEECKKVITTKEGLESIALYRKSVASATAAIALKTVLRGILLVNAVWGCLFLVFDCSMVYVRQKEDPWNSFIALAATAVFLLL